MHKPVFLRVASALALLPLAACITQRQYDDALTNAKYYQTKLHESEDRVAKLEAEAEKRRKALAQQDVSALSEANFGDLDSRLSELQSKIDGLGRPLNDIERFEVDGGYVLLVQDRILFDSGSADLNAEGKKSMGKIAEEIGAKPHGKIQVRGHTDSDPVARPETKAKFPHGNLQLSAMRAIEVASALQSVGKVPARDITIAGFGQWEPIKENNSADNKRMNRRVEIFVADMAQARAAPASK